MKFITFFCLIFLSVFSFEAQSSKACVFEYDDYVVPKSVFDAEGTPDIRKNSHKDIQWTDASEVVRIQTEQETCNLSFEELMRYVGLDEDKNSESFNTHEICNKTGCLLNFKNINPVKVILKICGSNSKSTNLLTTITLKQRAGDEYEAIKISRDKVKQCFV